MIDRPARSRLAEGIRHLVGGQVTNDDFELRVRGPSYDPAVREVFFQGAWMLYSDTSCYQLRGSNRLSRVARREAARWILFLASEHEYEWPRQGLAASLALFVSNAVTFGGAGWMYRRSLARQGDLDVWPFYRRNDYEASLRAPAFRRGAG